MSLATLLARLEWSVPADTFLRSLPADLRDELLAGATILEVPQRRIIFATQDRSRAGFVLEGLARTFLTARDGRHLTVRFARPGDIVGNISGTAAERAPLGVAAVTDCVIVEVDIETLFRLVQRDARVGLALVAEITARLQDSYALLAANALGSMEERVSWHLLELAVEMPTDGRLVAFVTQQHLADSVGTVREVVARVLRELRAAGIVVTMKGHIEVVDPARLAALAGRMASGRTEI